MLSKAVDQARARLQKAENATVALKAATSYRDQVSAWSVFLQAASTVYTKLEQGSKSSGASMGWFGTKKSERRKDPLLRYLHFARNCDEHGLEEITQHQGTDYGFNGEISGRSLVVNPIGRPRGVYALDDGPAIIPSLVLDRMKLVRVTDSRFGDSADPPCEHLGMQLPEQSPQRLAEAALIYLNHMVEEAAKLAR